MPSTSTSKWRHSQSATRSKAGSSPMPRRHSRTFCPTCRLARSTILCKGMEAEQACTTTSTTTRLQSSWDWCPVLLTCPLLLHDEIKSGRWSTAIRGDHYRSAKTSSSFDSTPSGPAQRPRGSLFEDQQPGADIRISADPSSARMPTSIDTNAEPLLSPLYLLILFSSLLSIYVWGTPLGIPLSPIEDHTSLSM